MKCCKKCKTEKNLSEFDRQKKAKDGYQHYCKACLKISRMQRYYRHREREIGTSKQWNKKNPERVARNMANCRAKRPTHYKEYNKTWKRDNREIQKLYDARKHAKRMAAKGATIERISLDEWESIKQRQKYSCYYCGIKPEKLTQDHVVPLISGGNHSIDNIVGACLPCNSSKHCRSIESFARERGRLFF